jgi:hypothetical protein
MDFMVDGEMVELATSTVKTNKNRNRSILTTPKHLEVKMTLDSMPAANARFIWVAECHYTIYNYQCPLVASKGEYYVIFKDGKGVIRVAKVKKAQQFYLEHEMTFVYQSQPS